MQQSSAIGVGMNKLTIVPERAGMRCFAKMQFGKRLVPRFCSSILMYASMNDNNALDSRYRKKVFPVVSERERVSHLHSTHHR